MKIKELFDLDWNYIDTKGGLKLQVWDSVLTIPEEFEIEKVENLSKDKKVNLFLLETPKEGGKGELLLILGLENVLGELGGIPILVLRPKIGLYNFWKLMDFFKKETKRVGKGIIILFPEFEESYMDYVNSTLSTFSEKKFKIKAEIKRQKL